MDPLTLAYYENHAPQLAQRYDSVSSPVARYFALSFAAGSRVLDVGAGSGRDLAALLEAGYDAYGVEPCAGLRAAAETHHSVLRGRLAEAALPALGTPFGGAFDGILCSAVLMHLQDADLFDAVLALRRLLKPYGRLLISLPAAREDVGPPERDSNGRLFKAYLPQEMQLLLERLGLKLIGRWETDDALQRQGTRWYTLLLELSADRALRAIDQIEGILNRDRKVATYKFALFRALAEIATQEPRTARWRADGQVGVPMERIAQRWLLYYWPIFASSRFVPQSQAEGAGTAKPLAFRRSMNLLMAQFAGQGEHGGLSAWHAMAATGKLAPETVALQQAALRSIADTIRSGPVAFAGGALGTGRVFGFDPSTQSVTMAADLWRELSLLGHWIVDAVTVRWAMLTERFARRQGISSGDVLPLLVARPDPARTTALARGVFLQGSDMKCVWSLRQLTERNLAVDHVIPFALWGNNDLWNLLPTHAGVNLAKSDRLPAGELLRHRQAEVVQNWEVLRDRLPLTFDRQAEHLLGRRPSSGRTWSEELFGRLREAVELTAMQRGVDRWAPVEFEGEVARV